MRVSRDNESLGRPASRTMKSRHTMKRYYGASLRLHAYRAPAAWLDSNCGRRQDHDHGELHLRHRTMKPVPESCAAHDSRGPVLIGCPVDRADQRLFRCPTEDLDLLPIITEVLGIGHSNIEKP